MFGNGFKATAGLFLNPPQGQGVQATGCCASISRAIYILKKPLGDGVLNAKGSGVLLIKIPDVDETVDGMENQGAFVIQLTPPTGTCPKGFCKQLINIITFWFQIMIR